MCYNVGMQVFVPSHNIFECARVLDNKRLRNQIFETNGILSIIHNRPKVDGSPRRGYMNHPAVLQWKHWPGYLSSYNMACIQEMEKRGVVPDAYRLIAESFESDELCPTWWGDESVHSTHRSRLLQKNPEHYTQFGWSEQYEEPQSYWWAIPVNLTEYTLERRGKS